MKLATYDDGSKDGQLWIVARDLKTAIPVRDVAPTLLSAIEAWDTVAPRLQALSDRLNAGAEPMAVAFDPARTLAPLPRAPQWLDASAFLNHGRLMDKAFNNPANPDFETIPLVYQGASDDFRGAGGDVAFSDETLGIDMEGEFGVILSDVPMGADHARAEAAIRLLVQINDWSLRAVGAREMRVGFGFIQAKPSTAFAPLAITLDEMTPYWQNCRVKLPLHVAINDREVGHADGGEMHFSFADIIVHCARTRRLTAGTIIGSGTVSNAARAAGSSCISEIRVIEMIDLGAAATPFLTWGDRVRMEARLPDGSLPFGAIDQRVVKA